MSLQAIPPRPPLTARSLLRLVHDRNPFYLLSALSMFVGFRVVIAALDSAPGEWRTLLSLIVTVNVYEAVLIGLALFLIVRRGLLRDGWILLGIDALFLVDLTNLNAELFTATPKLGAVVNGACFLLAMAKVGVVVRALRLRLTPGTVLYIAAQLAFMFALPGTFRLLRSSAATVSPLHVYAMWWAAGGLVAVGAAVVRRDPRSAGNPMAALPVRLYVLVPLASLLYHLASENRVYWVHFEPANVAPLLLAAVVAVNRGPRNALKLQPSLVLVGLAVLASVVTPDDRSAMVTHLLGVTLTPFRLVLLPAAAVAGLLAAYHHHWPTGAAVAAGTVLALVWPSLPAILRQLERAADWAWDLAGRLVPETALQWGYTAIAGSFLLLGVGAVVSLKANGVPGVEPEAASE